jgi:hypothetical protein
VRKASSEFNLWKPLVKWVIYNKVRLKMCVKTYRRGGDEKRTSKFLIIYEIRGHKFGFRRGPDSRPALPATDSTPWDNWDSFIHIICFKVKEPGVRRAQSLYRELTASTIRAMMDSVSTSETSISRSMYSRLLRKIALTLSARTQPGHKTVARIRCIPIEKILCWSEVGFCVCDLLSFLLVFVFYLPAV